MKLKLLLWGLLPLTFANSAAAAEAVNPGLRFINVHGEVRCGTDLGAKTYAYKDDNKDWRGIDADFCRALSFAIFGNDTAFKMVDVQPREISSALASGKIDVMLGNTSLSAKEEIQGRASAADVFYYDRQMFMAHPVENATSMDDYKELTVCILDKSEDQASLLEFNRKYSLGLKLLPFKTLAQAKEAFYLNRCQLFSASEIYLKGLEKNVIKQKSKIVMLPEVVTYRPVYAYVSSNNPTLRLTVKWALNALKLAEQHDITSKNINAFIGVIDISTRNLLGENDGLWNAFKLYPNWVKKTVASIGNYGEIFERNLGKDSEFNIERDKNYLIDRGGMISALPFI